MALLIRSPFKIQRKENIPIIPNSTTSGKIGTFTSLTDMQNLLSLFGKGDRFNIDCTTKTGQQASYDLCPLVQTIVEKRSQYMANGKYMINGKPIENVPGTNPIKKIILAPNPLQSIGEFQNQVNIYRDVFGYCPIYIHYPANRNTGTPIALWAINPLYFSYTKTNKIINQNSISGIVQSFNFRITPDSSEVTLTGDQLNQIYILKGRTSSKTDAVLMQSPLYGCSDLVNNFNAATNVYGNLIKQSILGIISNRSTGMENVINSADEKENIQSELLRRYGLTTGKDNVIVSNSNLFFQSLMTNVGNLQIPQAMTKSLDSLCDKLGFATELLAEKQGTYENKKAAEIGQYQNETIPDSLEYCRALSSILGAEIMLDFSHVAVLQEAKAKMITGFSTLVTSLTAAITGGLITLDDSIEILNRYKP